MENEKIQIYKQSYKDFMKNIDEEYAKDINSSYEKLNYTPLYVYYDNDKPNLPEFIVSQSNITKLYATHQKNTDQIVTGHYDISTLEKAEEDAIYRTRSESTPLGREIVNYELHNAIETIEVNEEKTIYQALSKERKLDAFYDLFFEFRNFGSDSELYSYFSEEELEIFALAERDFDIVEEIYGVKDSEDYSTEAYSAMESYFNEFDELMMKEKTLHESVIEFLSFYKKMDEQIIQKKTNS